MLPNSLLSSYLPCKPLTLDDSKYLPCHVDTCTEDHRWRESTRGAWGSQQRINSNQWASMHSLTLPECSVNFFPFLEFHKTIFSWPTSYLTDKLLTTTQELFHTLVIRSRNFPHKQFIYHTISVVLYRYISFLGKTILIFISSFHFNDLMLSIFAVLSITSLLGSCLMFQICTNLYHLPNNLSASIPNSPHPPRPSSPPPARDPFW